MRIRFALGFIIGVFSLSESSFFAWGSMNEQEEEADEKAVASQSQPLPVRTLIARVPMGADGAAAVRPITLISVYISKEFTDTLTRLSTFKDAEHDKLFEYLKHNDFSGIGEMLGVSPEKIQRLLERRSSSHWVAFQTLLVGLGEVSFEDIRSILAPSIRAMALRECFQNLAESFKQIMGRYNDAVAQHRAALDNLCRSHIQRYRAMQDACYQMAQKDRIRQVCDLEEHYKEGSREGKQKNSQEIEKTKLALNVFAKMAETYGYAEIAVMTNTYIKAYEESRMVLWTFLEEQITDAFTFMKREERREEETVSRDFLQIQKGQIDRVIEQAGRDITGLNAHYTQNLGALTERAKGRCKEAVEIYVNFDFFAAFHDMGGGVDHDPSDVARHVMQVYTHRKSSERFAVGEEKEKALQGRIDAARAEFERLQKKFAELEAKYRQEKEADRKIEAEKERVLKKAQDQRTAREKMAQQRESELRAHLDRVKIELERMRKELTEKEQGVQAAQKQKQSLEETLRRQREQAKQALEQRNREIEGEIRVLREQVQRTEAELSHMKAHAQKRDEEFQQALQGRQQLATEVETLRREVEQKRELDQQVEQFKATVEEMQKALQTEKREREEERVSVQKERDTERHDWEEERRRTSGELQELGDTVGELQDQLDAAYAQLTAAAQWNAAQIQAAQWAAARPVYYYPLPYGAPPPQQQFPSGSGGRGKRGGRR